MPQWKMTIDLSAVFHNDTMTFEERRDRIVEILRGSRWVKNTDGALNDLPAVVDELAETVDVDEFDSVWDAIYDRADDDRVWIKTRG